MLGIGDWWGHTERDWDLPPLRRVWSRFAAFSTLLTYDRRGTSMSDPIPPGDTPTLAQAVDDIVAVLDATEIAEVTLFTAASGVPLGLLFAASYPSRVTSIIAYNGYARFLQGDGHPIGLPLKVLDSFKFMFGQNWGNQDLIPMTSPGVDWTEETIEAASANMRFTASPAVANLLFPLLYECDVRHVLGEVKAPTLVMHSVNSPLIPVDHGRARGFDRGRPLHRAPRCRPRVLGRRLGGDLRRIGAPSHGIHQFPSRPCAQHGVVHRHRRVDGPGGSPGRSSMDRAARPPRHHGSSGDATVPRSSGEVDRRRPPRYLR